MNDVKFARNQRIEENMVMNFIILLFSFVDVERFWILMVAVSN